MRKRMAKKKASRAIAQEAFLCGSLSKYLRNEGSRNKLRLAFQAASTLPHGKNVPLVPLSSNSPLRTELYEVRITLKNIAPIRQNKKALTLSTHFPAVSHYFRWHHSLTYWKHQTLHSFMLSSIGKLRFWSVTTNQICTCTNFFIRILRFPVLYSRAITELY